MIAALRSRLTSAHAIALCALFVALGGTAAAQLERDTVGSVQIRAGAVGTSELRNGAVRPADLGFSPVLRGAVGTAFTQRADPVPSTAEFQTVVERTIVTGQRTSQLVVGQVTATRTAPGRGTLTLRGEENGEAERYTARATLDPGETTTLPLSFVCDPMPAGRNRYIVSARGTGFRIEERSIAIVALPASSGG